MLLAQKGENKLEESIIEALHNKSATGPILMGILEKENKNITKETFYRILRRLTNEEVINKQNGIYQLNRHWLQRIYRFSKKHIEENQGIDPDNILNFEEGDKIIYKFKNANLMGIYWAHTYDMLFDKHDPKIPILVYHPHEWLIHTRTIAETFFLNRIKDDKKIVFFAVGGNTELDKSFKKEWENKFLQIGIGINYGLKHNEYINVLGDFIFKITMSKKFGDDIGKFFKTHNKIDDRNIIELEKICNKNDPAKMIFTRSHKEAEKWRTKYKKHFYVPKI